jgi:hypothetical protein
MVPFLGLRLGYAIFYAKGLPLQIVPCKQATGPLIVHAPPDGIRLVQTLNAGLLVLGLQHKPAPQLLS